MAEFSRRQMMKLSAGALLAAGLWPRRSWAAQVETKPLKFIQVNDFHFIDDACVPFFEGLVKQFNQVEGVAMVLIVGDLVDNGTPAQCNKLKEILSVLKAPYHVTCGNHDPASQTDRKAFEAAFGNTNALNKTFESNGWQFVGLDTSDGTKSNNFDCQKVTLDYATALPGKLDKDKPTFLYTHFPLGLGVTNRLKNADAVLEPFKQLNLSAVFTGHHHAFTQKTVKAGGGGAGEIILTTDVCCSFKRANHDGTFQKGFFVMEAGADAKWKRTFVEYGTDFAGAARPNNKALPATRPAKPTDESRPWY